MMKLFRRLITGTMLLGMITTSAHALVITLDFETASSGSNLLTSPLATTAGTISLTNATSITAGTMIGSGNAVFHNELANPGYAEFSFSFDVQSISFIYTGQGGGVFTGEARDINDVVLDSFYDPGTSGGGDPFGPITLQGLGIRSFRFADTPDGAFYTAIDDLTITTDTTPTVRPPVNAVPEPSTMVLLGGGLIGLAFYGRKRKAA